MFASIFFDSFYRKDTLNKDVIQQINSHTNRSPKYENLFTSALEYFSGI